MGKAEDVVFEREAAQRRQRYSEELRMREEYRREVIRLIPLAVINLESHDFPQSSRYKATHLTWQGEERVACQLSSPYEGSGGGVYMLGDGLIVSEGGIFPYTLTLRSQPLYHEVQEDPVGSLNFTEEMGKIVEQLKYLQTSDFP